MNSFEYASPRTRKDEAVALLSEGTTANTAVALGGSTVC